MRFIISIALQLGQFRVPFLKSGNTLGGGRPLTSAAAALIPPSVPPSLARAFPNGITRCGLRRGAVAAVAGGKASRQGRGRGARGPR